MDEENLREQVALLSTSDQELIGSYSLVLQAADIQHWISPAPGSGWVIAVEKTDLLRAEFEISQYDAENANWPESPPAPDEFSPIFKAQSLLIIGSLMLLFAITGSWSEHNLWFSSGSANSTAILEGHQLYRLVTSLTLHADIVHLLGNCFLGGILLHYFFHLVGNGFGMAAILITSSLANLINAAAHGPGHDSVGFSTAVFAVIGMLSSLNYRQYRFSRPIRLLMPLMAGAALLAMLGSSGERTDLGAHLFGLLAGLITGGLLVGTRLLLFRSSVALQTGLAAASLAAPLAAWLAAMS
jgi:membrane associated rhomboid family serine protease